jgi:hypothetical protein
MTVFHMTAIYLVSPFLQMFTRYISGQPLVFNFNVTRFVDHIYFRKKKIDVYIPVNFRNKTVRTGNLKICQGHTNRNCKRTFVYL